jgi:hypothetical protein
MRLKLIQTRLGVFGNIRRLSDVFTWDFVHAGFHAFTRLNPKCDSMRCAVLYCTVLYCTVLYCTVLYCTVLYCTVLYCMTQRRLNHISICHVHQEQLDNVNVHELAKLFVQKSEIRRNLFGTFE